jgi:two-component system sensor histidine kinase CpxA
MKSLYAKLLLWALATLLITGVGFVMVSLWTGPAGEFPRGPLGPGRPGGRGALMGPGFRRFAPRQLEISRRAFETGGPEALRNQLEMMRAFSGVETVLTDKEGKDLVTGESHASTLRRFKAHRAFPSLFPLEQDGQNIAGIPSPDGKYWLLTYRPGAQQRFPLRWAHVWVFACAAVFSFFLARSLTDPVRRLRGAVERFGQGDFSARVKSGRGDEIGDLGRAFDQMADRIQTLVQAERRLLVDISHELRSPLTRLGLAVELARTGEDRDAAIDRIQREADRLNSLVGGLLEVNRGEADPAALRKESLRLDELLEAVGADCRFDAEARGCRIELKAAPVTIDANAELLRRAVENVLRNAVRYAPADSAIEVTLTLEEGAARIRIRDSGPGVPEDALPHLFDSFYRVRESAEHHQDGFGLGLSIARRAVELHRGKISAHNTHPGLSVEIQFPAAA